MIPKVIFTLILTVLGAFIALFFIGEIKRAWRGDNRQHLGPPDRPPRDWPPRRFTVEPGIIYYIPKGIRIDFHSRIKPGQ